MNRERRLRRLLSQGVDGRKHRRVARAGHLARDTRFLLARHDESIKCRRIGGKNEGWAAPIERRRVEEEVVVVMLTRFARRNILWVTRKTSGRTGKSWNKDQGVPEKKKGGARINLQGVRLAGTERSAKRPKTVCKGKEAKMAFFFAIKTEPTAQEQDRTEGRKEGLKNVLNGKRLGSREGGKIKRERRKGNGSASQYLVLDGRGCRQGLSSVLLGSQGQGQLKEKEKKRERPLEIVHSAVGYEFTRME